jgi:hypothetical protein
LPQATPLKEIRIKRPNDQEAEQEPDASHATPPRKPAPFLPERDLRLEAKKTKKRPSMRPHRGPNTTHTRKLKQKDVSDPGWLPEFMA